MKNLIAAALVAGGMLGLSVSSANAASLLTNGGFETGDFSGWTVGILPTYTDGGRPYNIDSSGDGWDLGGPISGTYGARNGFDGGAIDPDTGIPDYEADLIFYLQQDFTLTGPVGSATLDFSFDITGGPTFSTSNSGAPTEDRVFSVSFLDGGTSFADVYTYTVAGTTSDGNPLQNISLDVAAILNLQGAGTYTLLFQELIPQYFTGPANFIIDDISLNTTPVPLPAALPLLMSALGFFGFLGWRRKRLAAA